MSQKLKNENLDLETSKEEKTKVKKNNKFSDSFVLGSGVLFLGRGWKLKRKILLASKVTVCRHFAFSARQCIDSENAKIRNMFENCAVI